MNKTYSANIKLITKSRIAPFVAVGLPFFQLTVVLLVIICMNSQKIRPINYYQTVSKTLLISLGGLILISTVCIILVKFARSGHRADSFINVTSKAIIISRYSQRTIKKFRFVFHKKLYVIKYSDLESISLKKGKLIIKGKIRVFSDRSDRLCYSISGDAINFEQWWYNYNSNEILPVITLNDIFINTKKAAKLAKKAAALERDRLARFYGFRAKTLKSLPVGRCVPSYNRVNVPRL